MTNVGRNEPCPCGSGKKYKHCHGASGTATSQQAPEDIMQLLAGGMKLHQMGSLDEAERIYKRALTLSPKHPDALNLSGVLQLHRGNHASAIDLIERAIKAKPDVALYLNNVGEAHRATGSYEVAIKRFDSAVRLRRDYVEAIVNRGLSYRAIGNLGLAIRDFGLAMDLRPNDPSIFENLRIALGDLRQLGTCAGAEKVIRDWQCPLTSALAHLTGDSINSIESWEIASREIAAMRLSRSELLFTGVIWALLGKGASVDLLKLPLLIQVGEVLSFIFNVTRPTHERFMLLPALGLDIHSERAWNDLIFRSFAIPALTKAVELNDVLAAFRLETDVAFSFMQQPHTEEQARYCLNLMQPLFQRAANKLRLERSAWRIPEKGPYVVAFVHDSNINEASPAFSMFRVIAGLVQLESAPIRPLVVALNGVHESMMRRYAAIGVEVIDLDTLRATDLWNDDFLAREQGLREELAKRETTAVVFVNSFAGLTSWLAARRLAPVQIYWGMGYRLFSCDDITEYFAFGAPTKSAISVGGQSWKVGPLPMVDPYEAAETEENLSSASATGRSASLGGRDHLFRQGDESETTTPERLALSVAEIRDALGANDGAVLLGTIARPQKLDSDVFLGAVAQILKANPSAKYLWFGSSEIDSVRNRMKELGISDRCLFQGFVSVATYSKVLDIHLDSFPFTTGLTMYDTMSAGTSFVWMDSQSAREVGVPSHVMPLIEQVMGSEQEQSAVRAVFTDESSGELLIPFATSPESYVLLTNRLIVEPDYREKVGMAASTYMRTFRYDLRVPAKVFTSHILDSIISSCNSN